MGRDSITGSDIVLETVHARIHAGEFFSVDLVVTSWASGAEHLVGAQLDRTVHLRASFAVGGDARVRIYEESLFTGGSPLSAVNRNRHMSNDPPPGSFSSNPTVSQNGGQIADKIIPGGSGFLFSTPGSARQLFEEWILPSGLYLFRLSNLSGRSQVLGVELDMYNARDPLA